MPILIVGVNHRVAPIAVREHLVFARQQLPQALARLRQLEGVQEAVILSTCNRVEIYAHVSESERGYETIVQFLAAHAGLTREPLLQRLYRLEESRCVHHLFSVAAGLDSMVIGESEIMHQIKDAYEIARQCGATGKLFNVLFQKALHTAKTVRTQTALGAGGVSIVGTTLELVEQVHGTLTDATVLLIGCGTLGAKILRVVTDRARCNVRLMSRSLERAQQLAAGYPRVQPLPLAAIVEQLEAADVIISSASSTNYLVTAQAINGAMSRRGQRPLYMVDLGVPRTIDPSLTQFERLRVSDLDDVQQLVDAANQRRCSAVAEAKAIIDERAGRFVEWWREAREQLPHDPSVAPMLPSWR